jgi:MFS family permease
VASDRLDRRFRLFQSAVVCSDLADGVYKISVPLLALRLPSPAISVTVVGIAVRLPWLVATLPAGVIVDRYKPRKIMRLVSAVRLPLIAVLCWFAVSGQLSLWLLALGAFLIGCIGTVLDVAAQSFLPYLVDTRQLSKANASLQSGQMFLAQLLGPSLGGYATSLGPGVGVAAAGGLYLVTVCALQLLPAARAHNTAASEDLPTRTRPMRTVRAELTEGLSYFRERSDLLRLATSAAANNLAYSMCFTILPLWAVKPGRLGLSAGGYGLLLTCLAVGSVASGLLATRVVGKIGRSPLLRFGAPVLGLCFLAIAVPSVPVVAISLICYGVVSMLWNVVVTSYRQESIPPHLFGRVNAAYRWLTWGVIPLGALFGGVLASTAGNQTAFIVAGSLPVAIGVLLLLTGRTAATMIELPAQTNLSRSE